MTRRVVYFTVLIEVTLGNVLNLVIYAKHTKSTLFFSRVRERKRAFAVCNQVRAPFFGVCLLSTIDRSRFAP